MSLGCSAEAIEDDTACGASCDTLAGEEAERLQVEVTNEVYPSGRTHKGSVQLTLEKSIDDFDGTFYVANTDRVHAFPEGGEGTKMRVAVKSDQLIEADLLFKVVVRSAPVGDFDTPEWRDFPCTNGEPGCVTWGMNELFIDFETGKVRYYRIALKDRVFEEYGEFNETTLSKLFGDMDWENLDWGVMVVPYSTAFGLSSLTGSWPYELTIGCNGGTCE